MQINTLCQPEDHPILFLKILSDCSCTSNNPGASCPGTHGTGRKAMKAVTASQTKWEVRPIPTQEISPARTHSRPWFPAPALSLLQRQPVPVQASARKAGPHNQTPNGATVDLPQVQEFLEILHLLSSKIKTGRKQSLYLPDSLGVGAKVVRTARVPMGGWADETQSALRHHETLPEESSEDEMPPHVHRVKSVFVKAIFWLKIYKYVAIIFFCYIFFFYRCRKPWWTRVFTMLLDYLHLILILLLF